MRSRVLDAGDRALVTRLLDADPVGNCFVASRVEAGVLDPSGVGELWGYPAHAPRSLLHVGANIVPVAADAEALDAFDEATAATYAFSSPEGDLPAGIAIALFLWAVFAHQTSDAFVHWSALAFACLALVWVGKAAIALGLKIARGGSGISLDEERAPLVHGN